MGFGVASCLVLYLEGVREVITNSCLKYLNALTASLQAEVKDIVAAVSEIDNVSAALQEVRENIDTYHTEWFLIITDMLSEVGVEPSTPRRCGRQTQRSNVPADTPSEYFRRIISIPVLDHLISELKSRFSNHQRVALLGLSIVPSLFVSLESDDHMSRFKTLSDLYQDDLPSPECLESELHSWKIKWRKELEDHGDSSLPTSLLHTLRRVSSMYPNISALVKILCTLPVTTCTAERSFSSLKRSKTAFRSTMTNTRLTGLSLLHIHRDIPIDIEAAVNKLAMMNSRRMKMTDILVDDSS